MQYRKMMGIPEAPSLYGFGAMRMPTIEGKGVDEEKAVGMIRYAIDHGCSYLDTAYVYHGGTSEVIVGKALRDGYREKVVVATKLPPHKVQKYEDMEATLDESLERLGFDTIDFYLFHGIDWETFERLRDLGGLDFMEEMVAKGKVRYPSFSFHGEADDFKRIIDAYPFRMAQVQMNLLDTENQATLQGLRYAHSKGTNIVVMEPLRGGALASAPENVQAVYDAFPTQRSPAEWGFRFVIDIPEVAVILSGTSTMEQLTDTLRIFEGAQENCVTPEERALYEAVRKAYEARIAIGCTACGYCMPCPAGVDIPGNFRMYNDAYQFNDMGRMSWPMGGLKREKAFADACVECGACETKCPQALPIIQTLKKIVEVAPKA